MKIFSFRSPSSSLPSTNAIRASPLPRSPRVNIFFLPRVLARIARPRRRQRHILRHCRLPNSSRLGGLCVASLEFLRAERTPRGRWQKAGAQFVQDRERRAHRDERSSCRQPRIGVRSPDTLRDPFLDCAERSLTSLRDFIV